MLSDGEESDFDQQDLPEHHWEAIAIPATAPIIPVPPSPDTDSSLREMVTTIAAARLQKPSSKYESPLNQPDSLEESPSSNYPQYPQRLAHPKTEDSFKKEVVSVRGNQKREKESSDSQKEQVDLKTALHDSNIDDVRNDSSPLESTKFKIEMHSEYNVTSLAAKKSKQASLSNVSEFSDGASANADKFSCKKSQEITGLESTQVLSGKRGKSGGSAQDCSQVLFKNHHGKSPSPPKDFAEKKREKETCSLKEKESSEELSSSSLKKNKKKSIALVKETEPFNTVSVETLSCKGISSESFQSQKGCRNSEFESDSQLKGTEKGTYDKENESKANFMASKGGPEESFDSKNVSIQAGMQSSASQKNLLTESMSCDVEPLNVPKSHRKSLKSQEDLVNKISPKTVSHSDDPIAEKSDCNLVAKKVRKNSKFERDYVDIANASLNATAISDGFAIVTADINPNLSQQSSISDNKLAKTVEIDSETAAVGSEFYSGPTKDETVMKEKDSNIADCSDIIPVKSKRKGSKSVKASNPGTDCKSVSQNNGNCDALIPSESSVVSKAWNIQGNVEEMRESENFPPFMGNISKKIWGTSCEEDVIILKPEENDKTLTLSVKKSDKKIDGNSDVDSVCNVVDETHPKAKRGWEISTPQSQHKVSSPDMDIDKLTFEDLEAIVDAACKEGDVNLDNSSGKENKKGKKCTTNVVSLSKKSKTEENTGSAPNNTEQIAVKDLPKLVEDVKEEPVKSPEKPLPTPNRNTKAQRRKRR